MIGVLSVRSKSFDGARGAGASEERLHRTASADECQGESRGMGATEDAVSFPDGPHYKKLISHCPPSADERACRRVTCEWINSHQDPKSRSRSLEKARIISINRMAMPMRWAISLVLSVSGRPITASIRKKKM
jgi:hypothetical protein